MAPIWKREYVGDGVEDTYAVAIPTDSNDDILVTLDGVLTEDYTLDALGLELVFDVAPDEDAEIVIFLDTGLTDLGAPVVDPVRPDIDDDLRRTDAYQQRLIDDLRTRVAALEVP